MMNINIIIITLLLPFSTINCAVSSSGGRSGSSSGSRSGSSSSRSSSSKSSYRSSSYPPTTYYSYGLNPIPFYFIWFPAFYNPYISLNYNTNSIQQTQYCKLSNCNSTDQQFVTSTSGNYSIDTILTSVNNITNVTILNSTLSENYNCSLDVIDCVTANSAGKIKYNIYLILSLLGIIFVLN
jgi:hypothetical protein